MTRTLASLLICLSLLVGATTSAWAQDLDKGVRAVESGDYGTALREFRLLAEQGNATAQYNLGLMYKNGKGVVQDYKVAVK